MSCLPEPSAFITQMSPPAIDPPEFVQWYAVPASAICLPSGDQLGSLLFPRGPTPGFTSGQSAGTSSGVRLVMPEPSALMTNTQFCPPFSSQPGRSNAIFEPSGDHSGSYSVKLLPSLVSCVSP